MVCCRSNAEEKEIELSWFVRLYFCTGYEIWWLDCVRATLYTKASLMVHCWCCQCLPNYREIDVWFDRIWDKTTTDSPMQVNFGNSCYYFCFPCLLMFWRFSPGNVTSAQIFLNFIDFVFYKCQTIPILCMHVFVCERPRDKLIFYKQLKIYWLNFMHP